MSPHSNEILFDKSMKSLRNIALELNQRGIPLLIGADGIGIFNGAEIESAKTALQRDCPITFADLINTSR